MNKYPSKLKKGATIGLVAPSSQTSSDKVDLGVKYLKEKGFNVKLSSNLTKTKGGYMAGDEKERGESLNEMFQNKDIDAIFCIRGGDGGNRAINYLDENIVTNNPKIFVGYSDITSFHLLINQKCGLVTFHAPMVVSNMINNFDSESENSFFNLMNADDLYRYEPPKNMPIKTLRDGAATGVITGGNLTVICNSIGTEYEIDTKDKILFIEEINGHIGNIDRNIYQLKNAGKLEMLKGIIIGQFTNTALEDEKYTVENIIDDATNGLDIPIIYNIQSGHGSPMIGIPLGGLCSIDSSKQWIEFPVSR